ncbi:hypothetical protein DHW03_11410 [Pedobacter yonginense]|uniref:LPS export ABC transporter periplasmic protein LptC n=1 Tax=Pedobacter yonginense TaxID=651869 RepID=A0A317ENL3_9SPHI|nr:hypothetical protein [Pedobacter yonginense]PWS28152.1 hypothetical protein DHW03_11410 [Pedobacter yonginense]
MKISAFIYVAFLGLSLFLTSCGDDDLKNANAVASGKITLTRDTTRGVEIIYSDSARVKAKGNAPIMIKITPSTGGTEQEMPNGVKIDFFNAQNGSVDGTLISDYAIRKDQELKTTFQKNVIVKNNKGDTFSSEELIWDEAKKLFYSNQKVRVQSIDGNIVEGVNFQAPQDFSTYRINNGNGQVNLKDNIAP